jgi:hypothetical protein
VREEAWVHDEAPPCTLEALDDTVAREMQRAADEAEEQGLEEAEGEDQLNDDWEDYEDGSGVGDEKEKDEGEEQKKDGRKRKKKGKAEKQRNRRKVLRAMSTWRQAQDGSGVGLKGLASFASAFRPDPNIDYCTQRVIKGVNKDERGD